MDENDRLDTGVVDTILDAVADQQDALVELTRTLIACRTDSQSEDNPQFAAEARRCQDLVAGWLSDLGAEVQRWEEPPRYPVVAGVVRGAGDERSLAFNGHVDVVPAGDTTPWTHDPWGGETDAGRLWGRGAADMKGGVACALVAMRALRESGISLAGDLWAHVVCDEEVVGQSTRNLLQRLPPVDAVLVAEPTDLMIMPVEGGLVHFRIEVDGRESHAGNRYMSVHAGGRGAQAGVNAIEKMMRIIEALQDLERQWANMRHHPMLPPGFNSIMPGIIAGGPGEAPRASSTWCRTPVPRPITAQSNTTCGSCREKPSRPFATRSSRLYLPFVSSIRGYGITRRVSPGNCATSISRPPRRHLTIGLSGAWLPHWR